MKIIFNDDVYAYIGNNKKEIIEYLQENNIEPQPNEIEDAAIMMLNDDSDLLNEMINNFDKLDFDYILCVADLGLWYGRRQAQKRFNNLYDAIHACVYDSNMLYFKKNNSTLAMDSYHHDGCNKYKFYKVKNGVKKAITFNELMRV